VPSSVFTSHINQLVYHDFRGEKNDELAFLNFFIEIAQVLKSLVIVCGRGCFKSRAGLHSKLQTLCSPERGPANAAYHRFMLVQSPHGPWVMAIVVSFSLPRKEQGKASNICERNPSFLRKMQIIYLFGFNI
jgi:hypothetical protein